MSDNIHQRPKKLRDVIVENKDKLLTGAVILLALKNRKLTKDIKGLTQASNLALQTMRDVINVSEIHTNALSGISSELSGISSELDTLFINQDLMSRAASPL